MILIGDMLGVAPEDRDDLLRWSDDMVSAQSGNATEEQYIGGDARDGRSTPTFCTHAVAQRQAEPTDDLMSVLVHAEVDGDRLDARRRAARVAADPRRRRRDDPPRDQRRHGAAAAAPRPAQAARRRSRRRSRSRSRRCCAGSRRSRTCAARSRTTPSSWASSCTAGQKCMLLYESANRDETQVRRSRSASTSSASPTSTSRSASARTSASARRSPASSCA